MTALATWGPRSPRWRRAPRRYNQRGEAPPRPPLRTYPAHVGLWLDRKLDGERSGDEKGWLARRELYEVAIDAFKEANQATQKAGALATYRQVFQRYRAIVDCETPGLCRQVVELRATSRILLHPAANESVTEGALLLHHTYGVPYLPGSAIKGLTRSRLRAMAASAEPDRRKQLDDWADALLGYLRDAPVASAPGEASAGRATAQAALVEFLDALWIPPAATRDESPIALDLVNPHHPDYYTIQKGARKPPTDGDNPVPVERLTLAPDARFLLVAEAPADLAPWLSWLIRDVVAPALAEDGLGSWTSAGYGRLLAVGLAGTSGGNVNPAGTEPAWAAAEVQWIPGKSELMATLAGDRRAYARAQVAHALLESLPDDMRQRLAKRKAGRFEVRVEPEGASFRLVALRPIRTP